MWREYFPHAEVIVGVDIDETCKSLERVKSPIFIGDQEDKKFLTMVNAKTGPFDIIIDDGGHSMSQQITTFNTLFPLLKAKGVYVIEDLHTSYWPQFGGKFGKSETAVGLLKQMIDNMHSWAIKHPRASMLHATKERSIRVLKRFGFDISTYLWMRRSYKEKPEHKDVLEENIRSIYVADSICFIFKGKTDHHNIVEL